MLELTFPFQALTLSLSFIFAPILLFLLIPKNYNNLGSTRRYHLSFQFFDKSCNAFHSALATIPIDLSVRRIR
jgi:hypothetical protein